MSKNTGEPSRLEAWLEDYGAAKALGTCLMFDLALAVAIFLAWPRS